MKTSASYLRDIEWLRNKHSEHFRFGKWVHMQTIRRKIIESWAAFHRATERENAKS